MSYVFAFIAAACAAVIGTVAVCIAMDRGFRWSERTGGALAALICSGAFVIVIWTLAQ